VKIVFLLPREGTYPSGGFKVIYEYANRLSRRGHDVHLIHVASLRPKGARITLYDYLSPYRYLRAAILRNWRASAWFSFEPNVKQHWFPMLAKTLLPRADAYVATWWTTAQWLGEIKSLPGRRLYLIQHLETWSFREEAVMATWKYPLEKIVIAQWLKEIADRLGEACRYIPNGLDFTKFGCDVSPAARQCAKVGMLYNTELEWKGSQDGLTAVQQLKLQYPELEAEFFGIHERPVALPSWITYHCRPTQQELRNIYNRVSMFLAPSHSEGWGLPPCEAMMCGAAVLATDIGGHREFCINGVNSLLVAAKDPGEMAKGASRLIADKELRVRLANSGCQSIQRFTWDVATDAFEQVLLGVPTQAEHRQLRYQTES